MKRHFQVAAGIKESRGRTVAAKHREAADPHSVRELVLFIDNTSDLSLDGPSGQGKSVLLNALRKWRAGTYDPQLAVKLFEYLAESGARRYAKEFGGNWSQMFDLATRHEAAKELEESFRASAERGEYDRVDTKIRRSTREAGVVRTQRVATPLARAPRVTKSAFEARFTNKGRSKR